jgi:hypothetical protein
MERREKKERMERRERRDEGWRDRSRAGGGRGGARGQGDRDKTEDKEGQGRRERSEEGVKPSDTSPTRVTKKKYPMEEPSPKANSLISAFMKKLNCFT